MAPPTERPPPQSARVCVPTFGLDGGLLPADPNTFVNFLAPKPTVLGQRVEEPANTSRKRTLPTTEPPKDQRQVERMHHLCETQLSEQVNSKSIPRQELPLSRIKRIMKEDSCSDPLAIGLSAPAVCGYACEFFTAALTERAWQFTERDKRQTLQMRDVIHALSSESMYSFLHDIKSRAMAAENARTAKRRCDA
jgi:histone H3/H4